YYYDSAVRRNKRCYDRAMKGETDYATCAIHHLCCAVCPAQYELLRTIRGRYAQHPHEDGLLRLGPQQRLTDRSRGSGLYRTRRHPAWARVFALSIRGPGHAWH